MGSEFYQKNEQIGKTSLTNNFQNQRKSVRRIQHFRFLFSHENRFRNTFSAQSVFEKGVQRTTVPRSETLGPYEVLGHEYP